tara:strand:+ start:66 stop:344 length:279 start_codon:yes stop_codon:yes gene_type:complete
MARVKHTTEQIIAKLRKAELMLVDGKNIDQVAKSLGVTKNTFYRWKKEYGNLPVNQAKQMKDLEKENARLKKIVANLSLDNDILKEVNRGNF